jgi:Dimethlysulfonioproprionate lyase
MAERSPALTTFLNAAAVAMRRATTGDAARAGGEVLARAAVVKAAYGAAGAVLPVCRYLEPALAAGERRDLAAALARLRGDLVWQRRASADPADGVFWEGHANAMILGPGGLEERDDVMLGATLMAPGVTYPQHSHPPEEVYLPLSPGEWMNADHGWHDPGLTGAVYNPPGIQHSMRSGAAPFLALWFLPLG